MTVTLSRTSVPPGGQVLVWSHLGNLDATAWRLVGPSGTVTPAWSQPSRGPVVYWTSAYCHQLTVPPGVVPGLYTLTQPNHPPVGLTVILPPKTTEWLRYTQLNKDDAATQIEAILRHGDLNLSPGYYELARPITIPAGRRLRGHGAILRVGGPAAFRCGDGVSLEGLTLHGGGQWLADVNPVATNLTLADCTFRGVMLAAGRGLQTTDCTWDRCGVIAGTEHYHLRPRFTGLSAGSSTLIRGSGAAIVDGVWRDTDRGPIAQTHQSDVSDCLIVHPDMSGLSGVFNGCEGVAAEGSGRSDRNLILHLRYRDSNGPAFQITGPSARDNVIRDFSVQGGTGIVLDSGENMIENTQFASGEMRNCSGVVLGKRVTGTRWSFPTDGSYWPDGRQELCRLVNPQPTSGSQFGMPVSDAWKPWVDLGDDNEKPGIIAVAERLIT